MPGSRHTCDGDSRSWALTHMAFSSLGSRRGEEDSVSEEARLRGQDLLGQEDVDRAANALPSSPCPGQGAGEGGPSAPAPDAWGNFLRKAKAALAGLPEIPNVWALAWEGPENNVGAWVSGRTLCDPRGFQACCCSSSPLPGAPAAGVTLNPGPGGAGCRGATSPATSQWPSRSPGPFTAPPQWRKEGRKNEMWV